MSDFSYVGGELEVFAHATQWKSYVRSILRRYLTGDILEVGAGIGSATQALCDGTGGRWVCLEPDAQLAGRIPVSTVPALRRCKVVVGTLSSLEPAESFDAIIYMDVLEHIADDAAELSLAARRLNPKGVVAVLSPALPWLYTPFDAAIGHHRRYTKKSLRAIAPPGLCEETCIYLDAVGFLASAANKLFLRSAAPSLSQIRFWDKCLVPVSRLTDGIVRHGFGRSILAVWRRVDQ
jgi:SAM-dependent methyltransferase